MKTIKMLKKRTFRHLDVSEIEDPLFPLMELCCSETTLDYYRREINLFTRASCCHNIKFRPVDFGLMYFVYNMLCKHMELLFVFMHRYNDWTLSPSTSLYQYQKIGNYKTVYDEDMYHGTTMEFKALNNAEFVDLKLFMDNFFQFQSLMNWRRTMDSMMDLVFSEESFGQLYDEAQQIFEYLDKLGEAMFLAYEIHGKAYMLEHHADRFGIKRGKPVDTEPTNLPEGSAAQTETPESVEKAGEDDNGD